MIYTCPTIEQRPLFPSPRHRPGAPGAILLQVSSCARFRPFHPRGKRDQGVGNPISGWERVGGGRVGGAAGRGQEHTVQGQAATPR